MAVTASPMTAVVLAVTPKDSQVYDGRAYTGGHEGARHGVSEHQDEQSHDDVVHAGDRRVDTFFKGDFLSDASYDNGRDGCDRCGQQGVLPRYHESGQNENRNELHECFQKFHDKSSPLYLVNISEYYNARDMPNSAY